MEYLVLAGNQLQASLAETLGDYAPLFWSVIAPIGLLILWAGAVYALWETWFRQGRESGGGGFLKLVFSLLMVVLILCSGTGVEFLVFGGGHIHARILGALVNLARLH